MIFQNNDIKRIDMIFTSEDWQAMLDDMTELYGEFGIESAMNSPTGIDSTIPEGQVWIPPGE